MTFERQKIENELLGFLSKHIRVASLPQLAAAFEISEKQIGRVLSKLKEKGLITAFECCLPKLPVFRCPLISSRPNEDVKTKFASISWQLSKRASTSLQSLRCVCVTKRGAAVSGGWVLHTKPAHLFHDLCTAAVFLRYRETDIEAAASWISEEHCPSVDERLSSPTPDAFIGVRNRVIEIGGPSYRASRLETLFDAFSGDFEFELW